MAGEFEQTLTVPVLTFLPSYVSVNIKSRNEYLTAVEIFFPPGCAGLCYVALFCNGTQFMPDPMGSNEWYHGEGSITWFGSKRIAGSMGQSEYDIEVRAYNEDDSYVHHPIIRIDTGRG